MGGWAVGTSEGEVIGYGAVGEGQVGRYVWVAGPGGAHVDAVDKEGKTWLIGCVEACCTDDGVDRDRFAAGGDEACGRDLGELGGVDGGFGRGEGFEVAVAWCRPAATDEEVGGPGMRCQFRSETSKGGSHDLVNQSWSLAEQGSHFVL
jgi:hypothetical protein